MLLLSLHAKTVPLFSQFKQDINSKQSFLKKRIKENYFLKSVVFVYDNTLATFVAIGNLSLKITLNVKTHTPSISFDN